MTEGTIKHADWPTEQSGPIQLGSQLQTPVSGIKAPWPWHWSGHCALGSSQLGPPQPGLQWHSPFTQMPLFEQVGSKQSTAYNTWESWVRSHLSWILKALWYWFINLVFSSALTRSVDCASVKHDHEFANCYF